MKCSKCGCLIEDNRNMCLRCGNLVKQNNFINIKKKRKHRYNHNAGTVILCILLILSFLTYREIKYYHIKQKITPIEEIEINKDSFNYVNELYKSDHRNYTYLLDDKQKKIYKKLLSAIKKYEPSITFYDTEIDAKYLRLYILKIYDALNMDHPELLQLGTISIPNKINKINTINITYVIKKENLNSAINEIQNKINSIKKETNNLNDYEKAKYIYEYLSKNNTYDNTNNYINQSAYSALSDNHNPVCMGYTKASQILLQNIGINSIMNIGTINSTLHAWNLIELNGRYYYFDVTFSDYNNPNNRYKGFLKKSDNYSYLYKKLIPKIKNNFE